MANNYTCTASLMKIFFFLDMYRYSLSISIVLFSVLSLLLYFCAQKE